MRKKAKRTSRDSRYERFALEYVKDLNLTQAAIRTGYSKRTAYSQGSRLLKNAEVAALVAKHTAKRAAASELSIDRVLLEIRRLAFQDVRKLYDADGNLKPIQDLDDDTAACIAGFEQEEIWRGVGEERENVGRLQKIKRWDKLRALDQAMSYLGMHKTIAPGAGGSFSLSIELSGKKARP